MPLSTAFWHLPHGCDLTGSINACRPFLVGDLHFGCCEASPQETVKNAVRLMTKGNMDAVKLEGTPATALSCSKLQ